MDDNEPKIQSWNLDSQHIDNSPEMQRQQTANWSKVGESMIKDDKEHLLMRWYFNLPMVVLIIAVSYFFPNPIGPILVIIFMGRVIVVSAKSSSRPGKTLSIIGWIVLTLLFVILATLI